MKEIGKAAAIARLEIIVIITLRLISLVAREACRQQMENALVSIALAFGEIGKTSAGLEKVLRGKVWLMSQTVQ